MAYKKKNGGMDMRYNSSKKAKADRDNVKSLIKWFIIGIPIFAIIALLEKCS